MIRGENGGIVMDLISKEKVDVRVEDIIEQLRLHEEAVRQILHGGIEIHKKGLKAEMYWNRQPRPC